MIRQRRDQGFGKSFGFATPRAIQHSKAMHVEARSPNGRKFRLAAEGVVLFIGLPAVTALIPALVIPVLVVMAVGCSWVLHRRHGVRWESLVGRPVSGLEWRRILILYLVAVPALLGFLWLGKPANLFLLPRAHPRVWLLVMVAYPLISVIPQELIYRVFLFARYRPLLGHGRGMVLASAMVFAFGHIVFHNWLAVGLTFLGGLLFATTYRRTGSLWAVAVEHALYGCAIFTLGFGEFFYAGTLRWFH